MFPSPPFSPLDSGHLHTCAQHVTQTTGLGLSPGLEPQTWPCGIQHLNPRWWPVKGSSVLNLSFTCVQFQVHTDVGGRGAVGDSILLGKGPLSLHCFLIFPFFYFQLFVLTNSKATEELPVFSDHPYVFHWDSALSNILPHFATVCFISLYMHIITVFTEPFRNKLQICPFNSKYFSLYHLRRRRYSDHMEGM